MSLRLRPALQKDYVALAGMVENRQVAAGLFDGPPLLARLYLRPDASNGPGPAYAAERQPDGQMIGGGRLEARGFSYFVRHADWGQGHGGRIAALMLAEFQALYPGRPAVLDIRRENRASIRVAERLGFGFEGLALGRSGLLRFVRHP